MQEIPTTSRRTFLIGISAAVGLIIFIALIAFVLFGSSKKNNTANTSGNVSQEQVATKDQVKQNLDTLDGSMQKAKTDLEAANASLKDDKKRVKVGS